MNKIEIRKKRGVKAIPVKDHLSLEQNKKLQKALKPKENLEVRERILILLLLNDGKMQREVVDFIDF